MTTVGLLLNEVGEVPVARKLLSDSQNLSPHQAPSSQASDDLQVMRGSSHAAKFNAGLILVPFCTVTGTKAE